MSSYISVNGEKIAVSEVRGLIDGLYRLAHDIAGEYHGMERSEKFRANWPDEDLFAKANWKNFVADARTMYAQALGNPKTPPNEARSMHLALVLEAMVTKSLNSIGVESDNSLQLHRGTQQFEGDAYENKKIMEKFGGRANLRAHLLNEAAKLKGNTWH